MNSVTYSHSVRRQKKPRKFCIICIYNIQLSWMRARLARIQESYILYIWLAVILHPIIGGVGLVLSTTPCFKQARYPVRLNRISDVAHFRPGGSRAAPVGIGTCGIKSYHGNILPAKHFPPGSSSGRKNRARICRMQAGVFTTHKSLEDWLPAQKTFSANDEK